MNVSPFDIYIERQQIGNCEVNYSGDELDMYIKRSSIQSSVGIFQEGKGTS